MLLFSFNQWTGKEEREVRSYFKEYFATKTTPGMKACLNALQKSKVECFSWPGTGLGKALGRVPFPGQEKHECDILHCKNTLVQFSYCTPGGPEKAHNHIMRKD
jgi:hypothetical protein